MLSLNSRGIVHFLGECPSKRPLWAEIATDILKKNNKQMQITLENIILGVRDKIFTT